MSEDVGLGPTYVRLSVIEAWAEMLKLSDVDVAQGWDDAGGDSIAALQLLLRLEQAIGVKLPFQIIGPDTKVLDLVAAAEHASTPIVASAGPRVFLLPGLFGYEAILRDLQVQLREHAALEILELPDLSHGPACVADLEAAGRITAAEIERRQPTGSVLLGGFSYGGAVAYEAARALSSNGRTVAFLAILDTPLQAASWSASEDLIGYRIKSMHEWRPKPCRRWRRPTAALLVASHDFSGRIMPGWKRLLPGLRTSVVPGGHAKLLRTSLPAVVEALRQAIDAVAAEPGRLAAWLIKMKGVGRRHAR